MVNVYLDAISSGDVTVSQLDAFTHVHVRGPSLSPSAVIISSMQTPPVIRQCFVIPRPRQVTPQPVFLAILKVVTCLHMSPSKCYAIDPTHDHASYPVGKH